MIIIFSSQHIVFFYKKILQTKKNKYSDDTLFLFQISNMSENQDLQRNLIFNPEGNDDVSVRTIIKGSTTGIFNLNDVKYPWAKAMYQVMIGNFWVPEKVKGLKDDARFSFGFVARRTARVQRNFVVFDFFGFDSDGEFAEF